MSNRRSESSVTRHAAPHKKLAAALAVLASVAGLGAGTVEAGYVRFRSGGFVDNAWYYDRVMSGLKGGAANDCCDDWGLMRMESRYQTGALKSYGGGQGGLTAVYHGHYPAIRGYERCKDDWPNSNTFGGFSCWRQV